MIGDELAAALPELRAEAESRMRNTCTVRPVLGVTDGPKGEDVTVYGDVIYAGKCRLRDRSFGSTDVHVGSTPVTVTRLELHIPHDSPAIPVGAVVTFVDGTPAHRVRDTAHGDDVTARRYALEVAQ